MYPQPDPVDPVDVAYERIFLELPSHGWRRYDFRAMSHAERTAAAMLVRAGTAELRVRCSLRGSVCLVARILPLRFLTPISRPCASLPRGRGHESSIVWVFPMPCGVFQSPFPAG